MQGWTYIAELSTYLIIFEISALNHSNMHVN